MYTKRPPTRSCLVLMLLAHGVLWPAQARAANCEQTSGGQAAAAWESPTSPNYDRVRDTKLAPQGLSEAQVQIVWVKQANPRPTVPLPDPNADARRLVQQSANIARAVKVRYPNVKLAFYSSRIYAGYASTSLNPEPYAYESGFAVKWLIEAQVNQMAGGPIDPLAGDLNYDAVAPWIAWGPYLWADGLNPRSDGLIWQCADLEDDGTHPSTSGESKVGAMLLNFMLTSPFTTTWFRAAAGVLPGDFDGDCDVDLDDFGAFAGCYAGAGVPVGEACWAWDLDGDGDVDLDDWTIFEGCYTGASVGCPWQQGGGQAAAGGGGIDSDLLDDPVIAELFWRLYEYCRENGIPFT